MKKEEQEAKLEDETKNNPQNKTIEELEHHIEDLSDRLLRAVAEGENLRRRYEKQIEEIRDYAITNFAKDLIPVMDNFARAAKYSPENLPQEAKSFIDGLLMTHKELEAALGKHGIAVVEPREGDTFDYNIHHAISHAEVDHLDEGAIAGLMQPGYKIKDRLLRPASVSIAKRKS